jgi:hypothetical protein
MSEREPVQSNTNVIPTTSSQAKHGIKPHAIKLSTEINLPPVNGVQAPTKLETSRGHTVTQLFLAGQLAESLNNFAPLGGGN